MPRRLSYPRIAAAVLPFTIIVLAWLLIMRPPAADDGPHPYKAASTKAAFAHIYETARWGVNEDGKGTSGMGSTLSNTLLYRVFLAQFMAEHDIKSVVDAGCGDWEFSHTIDWTGIDYKGFDIVDSVIASDIAKYAKPHISFAVANIVDVDLPPADLLIVKHVLQHLSNADVQKFLTTQLKKYKHVLLTDGVTADTLTGDNRDIVAGSFRPLDPTKPPFSIVGRKVLTYVSGDETHQIVYITPSTPSP